MLLTSSFMGMGADSLRTAEEIKHQAHLLVGWHESPVHQGNGEVVRLGRKNLDGE
jgi:hypothetical protein